MSIRDSRVNRSSVGVTLAVAVALWAAGAAGAGTPPGDAVPGGIAGRTLETVYGLSRRVEPFSGRHLFEGPGLRIAACAGMEVVIVNGREVVLSRPVEVRRGDLLFPDDFARALKAGSGPAPRTPSAPPEEESPRLDRGVVVLDPGHGGDHTGGRGATGICEKTITLDVSLRLRDLLQKRGIRVVMTRTTDAHLDPDVQDDLDKRVTLANRTHPDLFLSVHVNWAKSRDARGFEVYVHRGEAGTSRDRASRDVAEGIVANFERSLSTPNRGLKEAGFYVIRNTRSPAVLVEVEFVSNPQGERDLSTPAYRQKLADLIADAVVRHFPARATARDAGR